MAEPWDADVEIRFIQRADIASAIESIRAVLTTMPIEFICSKHMPIDNLMHAMGVLALISKPSDRPEMLIKLQGNLGNATV